MQHSHSSRSLLNALSLWKKRSGVQALHELGVLGLEPDCELTHGNARCLYCPIWQFALSR